MEKPIYLFTGPELGERNEEIQKVKSSLKKKLGSIEEFNFYATETPVYEFMSVLQNESLFSNGTCVVVKNAESITSDSDIKIISKWVEDVQIESSVLILVSESISVDKKLEKFVPPSHKKIFWEMFESKKVPWILNYFNKNGYIINSQAATGMLDLIENNTEAIKKECAKIFMFYPKGSEITIENIETILAHDKEESVFTLFDIISNPKLSDTERFEKGLEVFQKISMSLDFDSVKIIAGLTSCFRKLSIWKKLQNNADELEYKKNGFTSKKMKEQYSNASKIWSTGQIVGILASLSSTDMQIRSSGKLLSNVILQRLLYEIIIKKGNTSSVYE